MRFASKSEEYNRTVRQPIMGLVQGPAGPERIATRDGIMAQFIQGGLTSFEKEQCRNRFTFLGQYEGEDVMRRISLYDTEEAAKALEWDAETKAEVEQNLLEGQNEFYFLLEEFRQPKPWPNYDEQRQAAKIAETVSTLGLDVEAVIAYERENENRKAVIDALVPEIETVVTA